MSVRRRMGAMVSIGALILVAIHLGDGLIGWSNAHFGWRLGVLALIGVVVVLTLGAFHLPQRLLRRGWACFPILYLVLVSTWVLARSADDDEPSVWVLEPAAVGFAAVSWTWRTAIGYALIAAALLPLSLFLVDGSVDRQILLRAIIHLGNVAFVVIVFAIDAQLRALRSSEREVERNAALAAAAGARAGAHARLTALIHDEVLTALTLAMRTTVIPESVATQAGRALAVLRGAAVPTEGQPGRLHADLAALARDKGLRFVAPPGATRIALPDQAANALVAACAQAIENSLRHARPVAGASSVRRCLRLTAEPGRVVVTVEDDGSGFEPDDVAPDRLGLRASMLARMRSVPGGGAQVRSGWGRGTVVELSWVGPVAGDTGSGTGGANGGTNADPHAGSRISGLATPAARVVLVLVWATGAVQSALLWHTYPQPAAIGVALLVSLAGALALSAPADDPLPRWATLTVAAVAPVNALLLLPQLGGGPGERAWLLQTGAYLAALLMVRGRRGPGLASVGAMAAAVIAWGARVDAPSATVVAVLSLPVAAAAVGLAWSALLRRMLTRLTAHRRADAASARALTAERAALARTATELHAIARVAGPPLRRVVELTAVDPPEPLSPADRMECRIAEAHIRDRLRAPALAEADVAVAVDAARRRGVEVLLLDDRADRVEPAGRAETVGQAGRADRVEPLEDGFTAALVELIGAHGAGSVTVRLLPQGRAVFATVLCNGPGGDERTELDRLGREVHTSRDSMAPSEST
ncbi:hypothetical protein OCAE111667_15595 [Occultella aeris]|uniref:Histidine kinase/HSP90-like ATPase domain-containing protein n=1 Tax=Occultella aeris TaxID=2761496 RepID=A0A7M4DMW0_9MICO|nr:hypothetical protein [Occultella aeris]VZO38755.1 hypothetical protein HALOF300_03488 [Occultella aeris]